MSAKLNRVAETSTSAGAGNFTLAGADTASFGPNIRGFAAAAGTGTSGLLFFYTILHKTLAQWEDGIGYMSDATTLVRHRVIRSSNADAVVNFSFGDKLVMCADRAAIADYWVGGAVGTAVGVSIQSFHGSLNNPSVVGMVAGRIYDVPFKLNTPKKIVELMISVYTAAAAGTKIRGAICQRLSLTSNRLIKDLGNVDCASAGDKYFTGATNFELPAGLYFYQLQSDGTPNVQGLPANGQVGELGGQYQANYSFLYSNGNAADVPNAWPSTITGLNTGVNNSTHPMLWYRDAGLEGYAS